MSQTAEKAIPELLLDAEADLHNTLSILYRAQAEIESLQTEVQTLKTMTLHHTMRLAIHQIRGGTLDCKHPRPEHWSALRHLIEAGRVTMDNACEVYIGARTLTCELLHAETTPCQP